MSMADKRYLIDIPEVMQDWDWSKNNELGLDPFTLTHASKKRAWWFCHVCSEEWFALIDNRVRWCGCPKCGKENRKSSFQKTILANRGSLADQHPELLQEWDYQRNTITPFEITSSSKKKVWWTCCLGHSWQDTVDHRAREKRNCPVCSSDSKTSFPEQAIYFYFKQVVHAKNRHILYGMEIDVFLPDLKVGIEYNGRYWHYGRETNDNHKINALETNGIRIIVVTDGDENVVEDNRIVYKKDLNFAIKELFKMLNLSHPHIDVNRDRSQIYEQYIQSKKENSLTSKFPEIAAEWHPTKNGSLTPDMFDYSSNTYVWWQCKKCGREWEASINHRTSKGRSQCRDCNNKEAGLKKRGKNHFAAKPVVQCCLDNTFIKVWDCAADVERCLSISHSNIAACCSGKRKVKTAGGYK